MICLIILLVSLHASRGKPAKKRKPRTYSKYSLLYSKKMCKDAKGFFSKALLQKKADVDGEERQKKRGTGNIFPSLSLLYI